MEIIRDLENKEITLIDNGVIISKLHFVPSYFIWEFDENITSNNPIILSEENDTIFYHNLSWLMKQDYIFSHDYSKKTPDKIIWLSEHCFDLEDEFMLEITPRLIIEKINNSFLIYFQTPNPTNRNAVISFAPAGNGFFSKNTSSNTTFQDDLIKLFYHTLDMKKIDDNKSLKRIKNKHLKTP